MSGENGVFLDFIPVIRSHPVILVSFQHSESIGFASDDVGMRSDFWLNLTTFPKRDALLKAQVRTADGKEHIVKSREGSEKFPDLELGNSHMVPKASDYGLGSDYGYDGGIKCEKNL